MRIAVVVIDVNKAKIASFRVVVPGTGGYLPYDKKSIGQNSGFLIHDCKEKSTMEQWYPLSLVLIVGGAACPI